MGLDSTYLALDAHPNIFVRLFNPSRNRQGGIVQKEAPLHRSNVALWNPATKKADRVGCRTLADGRKVRCFRSNGEVVDA